MKTTLVMLMLLTVLSALLIGARIVTAAALARQAHDDREHATTKLRRSFRRALMRSPA